MMTVPMVGEPMIRIHYIEDNPIDQHALTREVRKQSLPYLMDFSSSLAEARTKSHEYDLILCDYFLSDGTILDILPALTNGDTPVIVVTGQADLTNAVTALKLGAKDYLVKDPARQYLSLLPIQIDNLLRQRQIERDRRWLSTLFSSMRDAIPFGVYLYEPFTGKVVYANKAFSNLWNIPEEKRINEAETTHQVLSEHIFSMVDPRSDGIHIFPHHNSENEVFRATGEVRIRGSKTFRYYTDRIPFDAGMPACYVSIFEDTTELSRARDAILQYSRELESLNTTLDQRVHDRTRQIEELMRKKDELIVSIGHDLRTPLTPLVALLPYLRDNESDPDKKRILAILNEGTIKIRSLVEKTLIMGSFSDQGVEPDESSDAVSCDLNSMVADIIRAYLPDIESKRFQVLSTIPAGMQVFMKHTHLHMILDNLIKNAFRFTGPDGIITLHGGSDRESSWFCISDTGIGLTAEDASSIFDEFYKADLSRNDLHSHGLGLSVVRKLVLLNNGHITVKSAGLGMGSRFCVSFPESGKLSAHLRQWD